MEVDVTHIVVRGIDDETLAALKSRAKQHRRSLEVEIRTILNEAVRHQDPKKVWAAIDRFQARLERSRRRFVDSTKRVSKDRER